MKTIYCIAFLLCFNGVAVFGQKDSSKIFEESKGTWNYPVENGTFVPAYKYSETGNDLKSCVFHTDSSSEIHAVFDGRVTSVTMDDDECTVVTRFGKYYILYAGLTKPFLKRGDFIKAGQKIAFPTKNLGDIYSVEIILFTKKGIQDPLHWFRNYDLLTK